MVKKIDILRSNIADGEWRKAILLAASFQMLGEQKADIMKAKEAILRPDFQRQIGRDVDALISAGITALNEKYTT